MKAVSIGLFVAMVGCASVQPISSVDAVTFKQKVLYSFGGLPDGAGPYASVIDVKGTLYGTTYGGGYLDSGTVFALDLSTGAEKVLYSFGYAEAAPAAGLIDVKGILYGTTSGDDEGGAGTVFAFDLSTGAEKTLYSFCQHGCADGAYPGAGLIKVKGKLYGTTTAGGSTGCNCGTVFSIDRNTGAHKELYSFCGQANCADGREPAASLIDVNGTLYGTTVQGGGNTGCGDDKGCGTVFSLDPNTGAETALYAFCSQPNCVDGAEPHAGLVDVNGILYGATYHGGSNTNCYESCGTVFSVDPNTGAETVLYAFCNQQKCTDGNAPTGLIDVNGKFYGTTTFGGAYGYGTVFVLKQKR